VLVICLTGCSANWDIKCARSEGSDSKSRRHQNISGAQEAANRQQPA
jgi:hypothetical protein